VHLYSRLVSRGHAVTLGCKESVGARRKSISTQLNFENDHVTISTRISGDQRMQIVKE